MQDEPAQIPEQTRQIFEQIHADLARRLSQTYSELFGFRVTCEVASIVSTTPGEYVQTLSDPCCAYTYTVQPSDVQAILDFAMPLAFVCLYRQAGGMARKPPEEVRRITDDERSEMGNVAIKTLVALEGAWENLLEIHVRDATIRRSPEEIDVASPDDQAIEIGLTVDSDEFSERVSLCYPLETLMQAFDPEKGVDLQPVTAQTESIFRDLWQLYQYDFSEFWTRVAKSEELGRFPEAPDATFTEAHQHPFFIHVNGHLAGFVVVVEHEPETWITQFFIVKRYRRKGVGRRAAVQCFRKYPGRWKLQVHVQNKGSESFWRKVLLGSAEDVVDEVVGRETLHFSFTYANQQ